MNRIQINSHGPTFIVVAPVCFDDGDLGSAVSFDLERGTIIYSVFGFAVMAIAEYMMDNVRFPVALFDPGVIRE